MRFKKSIGTVLLALLACGFAFAQDKDKTKGSIKGQVRVAVGSPNGVTVVVRQGDRELSHALTDKNGKFVIERLAPGRALYALLIATLPVMSITRMV